jgi:hypothetical protein
VVEQLPKMGAIYGSAHVVFAAHGLTLDLSKEINGCAKQEDEINMV